MAQSSFNSFSGAVGYTVTPARALAFTLAIAGASASLFAGAILPATEPGLVFALRASGVVVAALGAGIALCNPRP